MPEILVPSTGPFDAKIAFIGEAPGGEEELELKPFVGPAGRLLTGLMRDTGIARSECFIGNISRRRPPNNLIHLWYRKPKKTDPLPAGMISHNGHFVRPSILEDVEHLQKELIALKPNIVCAMGETALNFLTGKYGISSWRGSILNSTLPGLTNLKVIPVYHPAYLLRDFGARWETVEDLLRVKRESDFPEIRYPKWKFLIRPSFSSTCNFLADILTRLGDGPVRLTCDIETRKTPGGYWPRQIACVGFGLSKLEAGCIPILSSHSIKGYWSPAEEIVIVKFIRDILLHPNARIINQNFLYDAYYFAVQWGIFCVPYLDTMLGNHVCFPGKEKDLGFLASLYCEYFRYWKNEGRDWTSKLAEDEFWTYNCQDCVYTFEVAEAVESNVEKLNLKDQLAFLMSQFEPVLHMMIRGVRTDVAKREVFGNQLQTAIEQKLARLHLLAGLELNPNSPQQLCKFFYDDLKLPEIIDRKSHSRTSDFEALEKLSQGEPIVLPLVELIQKIRTLKIFKSNFIDAEGPRDRIYTSFNIGGANTFRYSSSTNPVGWGTNLQNVPKQEEDDIDPDLPDIRELFLPDPGYTLVEFDLSKADLHVVVWEAGESELKEALKQGVNIYKEYGTKVTGMPYRKAKSFIHGTDYGGSAYTMAVNCRISKVQSELAQHAWFKRFPGIKDWHKRTEAILIQTKCAWNRLNFRRVFFDRLESILPEALAWGPQSTVALVINTVLVNSYNKFEKPITGRRPDVELLLQVHDSLLFQILTPKLQTYIPEILSIFQSVVIPYQDPLIIPVDYKAGIPGEDTSWGQLTKMPPENTLKIDA